MIDEEPTRTEKLESFNAWWVAAGCLLLVVTGGAFWIMNGASSDKTSSPQTAQGDVSATSAPGATASGAGQGGEGGCPTPVVGEEVPRNSPTTDWSTHRGYFFPNTPAGPKREDNGIGRCFDHTPEGALLAASHWTLGLSAHDYKTVVRLRASEGPRKEQVLNRPAPSVPNNGGNQPAIVGFSFLSYEKTTAVVDIAYVGTGGYASAPIQLVWLNGDWMVNGDPTGGGLSMKKLENLTGYIPWGR